MDYPMRAQLLGRVAAEAAEEPDTIMRHPEVVDLLESMADDAVTAEQLSRVVPRALNEPSAYLHSLAGALAPYRDGPLDDAPELVEGLAFVAWVVERIAQDEQPTGSIPALALA
jgi:hypothetical protein